MPVHAIHHVQLGFAPGAHEAVRHFYGHLLGLTELPWPVGANLRFAAGAQRIELVPTEAWQPAPAPQHLAFEVDNLPELRSRLLRAQLPLVENRALPGYLRFYVKDPAGNQLEFIEPDHEQEFSE